MRTKYDDAFAGVGLLYILYTVIEVVTSYGKSSSGTVSVSDICWFLLSMYVFTSSVIAVYRFLRNID